MSEEEPEAIAIDLSSPEVLEVHCANYCVVVPDIHKFCDAWGVYGLRVDFRSGVIQGLDGEGEWADMGKHRSCGGDPKGTLKVVK